ncbi:hypothetical protein AAE02nite_31640 [Adhaeribacter aerolatus]|uniref:protein adenylyltransferase n=1 Tax=Adhaeribacter aerolatus TaxID=670289 RepID=A0A512B0K5_9BACT|nr:Fic family protein [Adhaeribacter aerolatus]GEO05500.1 hypothetical protein AAE02nite_31640 [Adhaeribacter aerolatus]
MADLFSDSNGVLINNLNITNAKDLSQQEANISFLKLSQLNDRGGIPGGKFDKDHFQEIHKALFGRIYPWAGETRADREFQGHKQSYATGEREIMVFAPYTDIDKNLKALSNQLAKENYLIGLPIDKFIDRTAFYLDQYNYTHVFREGNGRSMQAAISQLGIQAGYSIDFFSMNNKEDYNRARDLGIIRKHGAPNNNENLDELKNLLRGITRPIQTKEAEQIRNTPASTTPLLSEELARMEVKREFDVTGIRLMEIHSSLRGTEPLEVYLQRLTETRFNEKNIVQHKDSFNKVIKAVFNHSVIAPGTQDFKDAKRFEQSVLQLEKIAKGQNIGEDLKQKPKGPKLR